MNLKKVVIILLILLLLPFTLKLKSQDFGRGQSLLPISQAHQVGDILTVLIYEDSRASNQVETKQSKDQDASMSGGPGVGPLDFIPLFGLDASSKFSHDGKGEQLRNGKISRQNVGDRSRAERKRRPYYRGNPGYRYLQRQGNHHP